jgi:type II secretory pathway predicted ATPase ExeA
MTRDFRALYGLCHNPFAPDVPVAALSRGPRIDSFCMQARYLADQGGFAMVTGEPGVGKSTALRILAGDLAEHADIRVGVVTRPQASVADFYRELGELFGVQLRPHNRWNGSQMLRQSWKHHIEGTRTRPVLLVDEAQEMRIAILNELRLLASAELDSNILLTVVLAGDHRLAERLREPEFLPLDSRIRVRLPIERASPEELRTCLRHALEGAGTPGLMSQGLINTIADHAQGNLRAMMIMADSLLCAAADREAETIDENIFFDVFRDVVAKPPRNRRR